MSVTINGSGLASGVTSVPNLATFPLGPRLDGANMPAGCVLQVVNSTYSTSITSTTSAFADTGLTASITPKFSTSKILVFVDMSGCGKNNINTFLALQLLRNSTTILNFEGIAGYTGSITYNSFGSVSTNYLDSPATTSATTYKVQFSNVGNSGVVKINENGGYASASTITLMEIAQ
jgi:hypothetical protein